MVLYNYVCCSSTTAVMGFFRGTQVLRQPPYCPMVKRNMYVRIVFTHSCISTDVASTALLHVCGNIGMGERYCSQSPFFIPVSALVAA